MTIRNKGEQFGGNYYHYSDPSNRDSIMESGLRTRDSLGASLAEDDGHEAGVYMFTDRHQADVLQGDTWEVSVDPKEVVPDPFHASTPGVAVYTPNPVPPNRLKLLNRPPKA